LRILVNAIPTLTPLTGVGQYTYELLRALRRAAPSEQWFSYYGFVTSSFLSKPEDSGAAGASLLALGQALRAVPPIKAAARLARVQLARLRPGTFDLYFEPNFIPLPEIRAARCVVTVHDFSFLDHPEWHPAERVRYFGANFFRNLERADLVLTDSAFVREEALGHLPVPPERVRVVSAGCDHSRFRPQPEEAVARVRAKYGIGGPYFLYVGTIEPRKNLMALARAFERLAAGRRAAPQLVLCGHQGWRNADILREFERLAQREILRFLGHVPTGDLAPLYAGAVALAYPSMYEGFGLPVVEAMACGCPVLCSARASLPEVGGDAPLYVDPDDGESILGGLRRMEDDADARGICRERGLVQARRFRWENTASEVLAAFREVAGGEGEAT